MLQRFAYNEIRLCLPSPSSGCAGVAVGCVKVTVKQPSKASTHERLRTGVSECTRKYEKREKSELYTHRQTQI